MNRPTNTLRARCVDLDTRDHPVAILRKDSPVCRSEGFAAHARIRLRSEHADIIARLYQTGTELLGLDEIGLSTHAWQTLQVRDGDRLHVTHPPPVQSVHAVRGKVFGRRLSVDALQRIMRDIVRGRFDEIGLSSYAWRTLQVRDGDELHVTHPPPVQSIRAVRGKVYGRRMSSEALHRVMRDIVRGRFDEIELAMFLTAIAARALDHEELVALTEAMVDVGERLHWNRASLMDKHCVGGLPGNRTTPLVVAIVAANGLAIPKTSSRAITSPAGTADTMEMLAPVNLDLGTMRRVVESEGGCIIWGGSVRLSPVDDILIRIARVMDLDAEAQLVASVLSKKIAAGATHLVLDLPVGETAKVRNDEQGDALAERLRATAGAFGIETRAILTDGRQPVGRGIGPALEARDLLAVLRREHGHPEDLRERALTLAAALLEMGGAAESGGGQALAAETLDSGAAWDKFVAICEAQGGIRTPPESNHRHVVEAPAAGQVKAFDNRRLARVAKLAGAPGAPAAGLECHVRLGDRVEAGQPLYTLHAETRGELAYAQEYADAQNHDNGRIVVLASDSK